MSVINIARELRDLGVFAYLPAPTVTTTTDAGTYYPITGPFTNTVIELFSLGVDSIVFDCLQDCYVKIAYSGTFESTIKDTALTMGIKHNGSLETGSEGAVKLKVAGDNGTVSGVLVLELTIGDTIQLVIKSNQAGAEIAATNLSAALGRMF